MPRRRATVRRRRRVGFSTRGRFWFDAHSASRYVEFVESLCSHVKGEFAGRPVLLSDWERRFIEDLFGWKRKDAKLPQDCTRQYRQAWVEIPRKNGKSTLAACIALALLFVDREPGAEIYSAAGDREQARIIFELAKSIREAEPELVSRSEAYRSSIVHPATGGSYKVVSSDARLKHGFNAHGIVVDEVHVLPSRELIDTLHTSTGARRQPLEVYCTTAGDNRTSIAWEMHDYAERVLTGKVKDDAFLPVIFGAQLDDDWKSERVWRAANPHLGISPTWDYFRAEFKRACEVPGYVNTFKRLHLNMWTRQRDLWLDVERWRQCRKDIDRGALAGKECYAGLDLSATTDLSALVLLFPTLTGRVERRKVLPHFSKPSEKLAYVEAVKAGEIEPRHIEIPEIELDVLPFFWVPESNIEIRAKRDQAPYDEWVAQGMIKATPGDVVDYDIIRGDINDLGVKYNIREIAIDRWNASQITTQLGRDGFTMVPFGQGFASMGQPTKDFEAFVMKRRIRHDDHPVMNWCVGNVAVDYDPAGFPKPNKATSTDRIDGVVSAIMALGRAMVAIEKESSVYESRELLVIG